MKRKNNADKPEPLVGKILRKEKSLSFKDFVDAHGPRFLLYEKGYSQALMDVHSWFNTHGAIKFCKDLRINHKVLIQILRLFFECRNRFQRKVYDFKILAKETINKKGKKEWLISAPFKEVILEEQDA